jgi:hypothetical protein
MEYELYGFLFVSGASLVALALVRFRDRQRRRDIENRSMRRILSQACK